MSIFLWFRRLFRRPVADQWSPEEIARMKAYDGPPLTFNRMPPFIMGAETTQRLDPKAYERFYGGPAGGSMKD